MSYTSESNVLPLPLLFVVVVAVVVLLVGAGRLFLGVLGRVIVGGSTGLSS